MAIFKKLLASDSTTNKKTSIGSSPPSVSSAFSTFPRSHSFNVQPQQQQRQTIAAFDGRQSANGTPKGQRTTQHKNGTCSAATTKATSPSSSPPTATAASCSTTAEGEGLLDGIEDLCKCLYNRTLRREKIRLAVFSEKDRRLLYDSETIVAVNDRLVVGSHRSQCGRFQFLPHKDDKLDIAKMLFGTFPSAITMESLKIHTLSDINCVMVSRIFSVPRLTKYYVNATTTNPFKSNDIYKCTVGSLSSDSDNQSNYSTIRSLEGIQDRHRELDHPLIVSHHNQQQFSHHSCARFPLSFSRNSATSSEPPERFNRVRNSSLQLETNDVEDIMEMEELRAFSPNRLSRTRRRQLSQLGLDDAVSLRLSNRSRLSSCSSIADACALGDSSAEWKQYGFALILPSEFRSFIFLHILQIERELDRLILQIHKAVQDRAQFFQLIYEGWSSLCVSLCLLCNSPRLRSPVWLSLVSADLDMKGPIAADFCSNLSRLIRLLNTKETKFLFSTAISAVLMNQLAWIASVAPPDKCSGNSYRPLLFGASSIDPRQMPYNPAVAQWLELHSGIGIANDEPKFVKIVVVGQNRRLVATMLNVLSYFVRCSSVESRREKIMMDNHLLFSEQQPLYDFGRSLFAGICRTYSPHFVLSGFDTSKTPLDDLLSAIYEDVRHPMGEPCANSQMLLSLSPSASQTLSSSVAAGGALDTDNSPPPTIASEEKLARSVDLPLHQRISNGSGNSTAAFPSAHRLHHQSFGSSANSTTAKSLLMKHHQHQEEGDDKRSTVVVLIDTQNFVVKLIMAENCVVDEIKFDSPSEAIAAMFEEFAELFSHHCASDFLLSFLEDRLGSLLAKSNVLVNLLSSDGHCSTLPLERVSAVLDCDCSDLLLIRNIAAVYSPGILTSSN
ncbi:hypothetical protein niasHT_035475 [Heterodera trifolii]|uniref:UDENN FNIP1/2-type domain-containing protein n=1 Tax=Heterodera trifolii TaxID=157864 RepID=A0ABD2HXZ5_9BILA